MCLFRFDTLGLVITDKVHELSVWIFFSGMLSSKQVVWLLRKSMNGLRMLLICLHHCKSATYSYSAELRVTMDHLCQTGIPRHFSLSIICLWLNVFFLDNHPNLNPNKLSMDYSCSETAVKLLSSLPSLCCNRPPSQVRGSAVCMGHAIVWIEKIQRLIREGRADSEVRKSTNNQTIYSSDIRISSFSDVDVIFHLMGSGVSSGFTCIMLCSVRSLRTYFSCAS